MDRNTLYSVENGNMTCFLTNKIEPVSPYSLIYELRQSSITLFSYDRLTCILSNSLLYAVTVEPSNVLKNCA